MAKTLGPRHRAPRTPSGTQINLNVNEYQISFDKKSFDNLIQSQGIKVIHYRAVLDPTGMSRRGDNQAVQSFQKSSDGYIYKEAGEMTVYFSNNSNAQNQRIEGVLDFSTAYMTLPSNYDDKPDCPVLVAPWDRFYLKDIEIRVVVNQYVEASSTGIDKLNFPTTCVEHLMDSHGVEYREDIDYQITKDGDIKWLSQNRPGYDPILSKGVVYAIRYRYTPFFIIQRLLHEIRVSQVTDQASFQRKLERMPYQVQVIRENVFIDRNRDPYYEESDARYANMPDAGGTLGTGE